MKRHTLSLVSLLILVSLSCSLFIPAKTEPPATQTLEAPPPTAIKIVKTPTPSPVEPTQPPTLEPSPAKKFIPPNASPIKPQNLAKLALLAQLQTENGDAFSGALAFSPDDKSLAAATDQGELKVWDLNIGLPVHNFQTSEIVAYPSISFSPPTGRYLAAIARAWVEERGEYVGAVKIWDLQGDLENPRTLIGTSHRSMTEVVFSPSGDLVAAGTEEGMGGGGSAKVWETSSGKKSLDLYYRDWITSVAFSPDGKTLAGCSYGIVVLWDITSGEELTTIKISDSPLWGVKYSPDGNLLAVHGDPGIDLVDMESKEKILSLNANQAFKNLSFASKGRLLAAADGNSIRFWNIPSGQEIKSLEAPEVVIAVEFSNNDRILAALLADGTLNLWVINPKN